jgi:signal peptidase I
VLALVIKSLFVQAFYIPSPSMEPLFIKNDRILVQKVSYWGGATPSRGDIVVFKDPGGWLNEADTTTPQGPLTKLMEKVGLYPTGGHLVKRVIGIGGDRVVCCDAKGRITVNGKALNEKAYLPKGTAPSQIKFDRTIPKDHLWMMGDNRSFSYDSRGHMGGPGGGFVSDDLVVGKVFTLIWPWKRAEFIHRPATFEDIPDAK